MSRNLHMNLYETKQVIYELFLFSFTDNWIYYCWHHIFIAAPYEMDLQEVGRCQEDSGGRCFPVFKLCRHCQRVEGDLAALRYLLPTW